MNRRNIYRSALLLVMILAACTGFRSSREAQIAEQAGDWDQAVLHYLELVDRYPGNLAFKSGLLRAKIRASQEHFERGKELRETGTPERAYLEFQQAVQLDPTNQYARVELDKVREVLISSGTGQGKASLDEMKRASRASRPQPPVLNPRSKDPISLSFPKAVSVFDIYKALGKAFGINIQFDPKLRDQEVAIELEEVTAQDALEVLMRTANHFYKVLNQYTIIIAEDTPQNRRNYEDLVIQTFYLSNAEVKDVMTMLRSLVGAKNIASNDQLNAIILRDTADKVKVAERIIETNDKSRGEVVVDVELLQINTSRLRELGVSLSNYRLTQSLDQDPALRFSDLAFLNQGSWLLSLPSFIYDFVKNSSNAQLLASPQVRISDGEQAVLHIGDRVPIPVTTFNTGQTVGGNIVPITSFQYQDVGIRLDIEPRIHHNKEVTLNIQVEVSNLSGFVESSGGQQQPIIGTRTIESTIRLQDGETNFLAGLIRNDETNTDSGFPGFSDIPIIGRLFSRKSTNRQRTDLVLTLTPHIIRTPDVSEEDLMPIWVGTEANITFRGGSPRVESEVEGPFDDGSETDDAERIREMIRRRIESLPRGLRDQQGQEEEKQEPPGVNLVPSAAPPSDLFQRPSRTPAAQPDDEGSGEDQSRLDGANQDRVSRTVPGTPLLRDREEASPVVESSSAARTAAGTPDAAGPTGSALAATVSGLPVVISLETAGEQVGLQIPFEARLVIDAGSPVAHLPITLRYDPAALRVVGVESGTFLGGSGAAQVLADSSRPGRITLGASQLGNRQGVKGKGVLAVVTFRPLRQGETVVSFEKAKALTSELREVQPLSTRSLSVSVVPRSEAPPAVDGEDLPEKPLVRHERETAP